MGVDLDTDVRNLISRVAALEKAAPPPGALRVTGRTAADDGWLLCDGASYLRSEYAGLFASIGTAFGSADASHFNVPDLRGRVPMGAGTAAGAAGATAHALGAVGGEETHVLTAAELAAHVHPITDPGHHHGVQLSHTGGAYATGGTDGIQRNSGTNIGDTQDATTGITVGNNAGAGGAHNNLQPFTAINWWVKT